MRQPTRRVLVLLPLLLACHLTPLFAQTWNDAPALALVERAIARRQHAQADSALAGYRARAHGFVFFLAQVGEGLAEPPRLIKADELDVEVYWRAPDRSKQVILGWRDGRYLPTDIEYHRDHLGIVTNNFGDLIRLGDGDEVRDAVHPVSPAGRLLYDYALGDSLAIATGAGRIVVREVRVRPRDFARPLVVGTLYIDAASAALVRSRFSFTPAAYRDRNLEDISIVLESSLFDDRHWLPYRQEIEIRRRTPWLDFPARGIIRARWEIDDYALNPAIPARIWDEPAIGGLAEPVPGDSAWSQTLAESVAEVAAPINAQDMAALRVEAERIAGARALSGLSSRRLAAGSISDLARFNRVQGLTLGFGGVLGLERSRLQLRPYVAYGTADERVTGRLSIAWQRGPAEWRAAASRTVDDLGDLPVIAPLVGSFLAQEAARDYGDYVLLHRLEAGVRHRLTGRTAVDLAVAVEESRSLAIAATAAHGTFRPNPPLGAGTYRVARVTIEQSSGGIAVRQDLRGRLTIEAGEGGTDYIRGAVDGRWIAGVGPGTLLTRFYAAAGSNGLPAYRQGVLGGRGTLVGEPFRAYGGRTAALAHVEWRLDAPVPAMPLGSFASTGRHLVVAPFLAAGWTERPSPGMPWTGSDGVRPVAGLALEWLMQLVRVEFGIGLRRGELGLTVDINRDWWGLL